MAVGFTDKDEEGFTVEKTELGNVYYKEDEVVITGDVTVKYVVHPWISRFEVEGMEPRKGEDL